LTFRSLTFVLRQFQGIKLKQFQGIKHGYVYF